jgi:hypothetical protein
MAENMAELTGINVVNLVSVETLNTSIPVILLDWIGAGSGVRIQSSPMQTLKRSRSASADPVSTIYNPLH